MSYFILKIRRSSFRRALGDLMMTMFIPPHLLSLGSWFGSNSKKAAPFPSRILQYTKEGGQWCDI